MSDSDLSRQRSTAETMFCFLFVKEMQVDGEQEDKEKE